MAASSRSLQITDVYRDRLRAVRERAVSVAEQGWATVDLADFDATFTNWLGATTTAVADAQVTATRLSAGYLNAYLSSELGRGVRTTTIDATGYAGRARDGRPLAEAFDTARIATLVALKDGKHNDEALRAGLVRALRAVELDVMQAGRQSLSDALRAHPLVEGYNRAVSGTCGACMALSDRTFSDSDEFETHPGCQCVPEPRVKGVPDRVPRLLGAALFASMSKAEQDEALGEEPAELVRTGQIQLADLVRRNQMKTDVPGFISQAPLKALP